MLVLGLMPDVDAYRQWSTLRCSGCRVHPVYIRAVSLVSHWGCQLLRLLLQLCFQCLHGCAELPLWATREVAAAGFTLCFGSWGCNGGLSCTAACGAVV
jgi:hypothetical protein